MSEAVSGRFTLYGTSACHLCEIAQEMLLAQRAAGVQFEYDEVDISDHDTLFERYGLLIPVLRHPGGAELHWPFSAQDLAGFLGEVDTT